MLEKQIDSAVCNYAKTKGLLVYKFNIDFEYYIQEVEKLVMMLK
jgi:hypothetical protein